MSKKESWTAHISGPFKRIGRFVDTNFFWGFVVDFLDLFAVFRSYQGDIRYLETLCQVIREGTVNKEKRTMGRKGTMRAKGMKRAKGDQGGQRGHGAEGDNEGQGDDEGKGGKGGNKSGQDIIFDILVPSAFQKYSIC